MASLVPTINSTDRDDKAEGMESNAMNQIHVRLDELLKKIQEIQHQMDEKQRKSELTEIGIVEIGYSVKTLKAIEALKAEHDQPDEGGPTACLG